LELGAGLAPGAASLEAPFRIFGMAARDAARGAAANTEDFALGFTPCDPTARPTPFFGPSGLCFLLNSSSRSAPLHWQLAFSLGGGSFRHTRDFSQISVNKINNLRKSDYPEIFRRAKNIFREKKTPCNRHQKISTTVFWLLVDPPEIGISKISEDAN
jgi:hypothetical protein